MTWATLEAVGDYSKSERRSRPNHAGGNCTSTLGSFGPSVGVDDQRRAAFARAGDQNGRCSESIPHLSIFERYITANMALIGFMGGTIIPTVELASRVARISVE